MPYSECTNKEIFQSMLIHLNNISSLFYAHNNKKPHTLSFFQVNTLLNTDIESLQNALEILIQREK